MNLGILPKHRINTGNSVGSTCKFLDSEGKGHCDISLEISILVGFVFLTVSNNVN